MGIRNVYRRDEPLVSALLTGVLLGVFIGLGAYGFLYPVFKSEEWAAWVQAFAVLLGMVVAIGLSYQQNQHSSELFNRQQVINRKKEIDHSRVELRSALTQLSRFGYLVNNLMLSLSKETDLLETTENESANQTDRFSDIRLDTHTFAIKKGEHHVSFNEFLTMLERVYRFNQRSALFLTEGLKRIDFHKSPYAHIADETYFTFIRYEAIKQLIEEFIEYGDSLTEETVNIYEVSANIIQLLEGLIEEHQKISKLCDHAIENYVAFEKSTDRWSDFYELALSISSRA